MRITKSDLENHVHAFQTLDGLSGGVRRLTQEVEVLKEMLREKNLWDEQSYKRVMVDRLINDHRDMFNADYAYMLDETSFLKYRFKASEEEIAAFKRAVDRVSYLT